MSRPADLSCPRTDSRLPGAAVTYSMSAMTPRIRTVTYITAAALVIATTVGCGLIGAAKKVASNISTITDFSEKLQNGLKLTYRAEYTDSDGKKVTVEQQPPNSVYLDDTGPLIITADAIYACDNSSGTMTCTKSPLTSQDDATAALAASSFGSGGFMAGEVGIVLLLAASVVPQAKISKSSKKIAGQSSDCVQVDNLQGTENGDTELKSFTMCITDKGVVSEFKGTDTSGKVAGTTMTKYSGSVDPSLFSPPSGAVINDLSNPTPEPTDTSSLEPSDGASLEPSASPSA
jgi:hypothetical protein